MEPQADLIRSIPIFSALSREDVAKVLGKMEEISFSAGATIFRAGRARRSLLLDPIRRGASGCRQRRGQRGSRRHPRPQEIGSAKWRLLSGEPRSATIITVKEAIFWRLRREDLG